MDNLTTGIEPLVVEMPTVEINGKRYTMRRLGFRDVMFWLNTIRNAGSRGLQGVMDAIKGMNLTEQQVGIAAFLWGSIDLLDGIADWLASVLQVDAKDFADPNKFPLDSMIDIIEAVAEHPDLNAFFTKLSNVMRDKERSEKILQAFGNVKSI